MLLDVQTGFSVAQVITATAASTNNLDLGVVRNIGVGEELYLLFIVTAAFTDSGSDSTVTPSLQTDTTSAFGAAVTVRTYDTLAALTPLGTKRMYKLEPFTDVGLYKRFVQIMYTVANGNLTTGAISAYLTKDVQAWTPYAVGYTVQ
jgi:hypothetical protein